MFEHIPLMLAQEDQAPLPAAPSNQSTENQSLQPGGTGQSPAADQRSPGMGNTTFVMIMMAVLLFMVVTTWRTQSKEKKKRAELLGSLKKGDKIQTVGGIIGSVVEIKDNEVVVKVDENSNTRIRFTRGAIQQVVESKDTPAT